MAQLRNLPRSGAAQWSWQLQAACRDSSDALFFREDGERGSARRAREAAAKVVCGRCPIIRACREHALAARESYGVWGGLSEEERVAELTRRDAQSRRARRQSPRAAG